MKRLTAIILSLGIIFTLIGCGNEEVKEKTNKNIPENTVNAFFADFKKGNFEKAKGYLLVNKDIKAKGYNNFTNGEKEAIKYWIEKTGYEIKSSEENGDEGKVIVKISALDGEKIYKGYVENLKELRIKASSEKDKDKKEEYFNEYDKKLIEFIKSKNNEIVTNKVDINLKKQDDKWFIIGNKDLVKALYGGLNPEKLNF